MTTHAYRPRSELTNGGSAPADSLEGIREASHHADLEWAASGAMWLTGNADGPPLLAPGPFASHARAALDAIRRLARNAGLDDRRLAHIDAAALLGERAAIAAFSRRGTTSAGGSCRLLPCADGWIAVNLARADDLALVPAWLADGDDGARAQAYARGADPCASDPASAAAHVATGASGVDAQISRTLAAVAHAVRTRRAAGVVARARLLGLAVAESAAPPKAAVAPWRSVRCGPPAGDVSIAMHDRERGTETEAPPEHASAARLRARRPLVVDLSSLWAGPLATHLLALAGADVVKVESTRRPDGARNGPADFYELLNAGKRAVAVDFTTCAGRNVLYELLLRADIVVEASRPRALAQLGIDAEAVVKHRPGTVWVSITGYGRGEPAAGWVAFGDDATAAAGVTEAMSIQAGTPVFCGDAIADPLTGLHAAHAALAAWTNGGGVLLDLSLRDVTAHLLTSAGSPTAVTAHELACAGSPTAATAHSLGQQASEAGVHRVQTGEWEVRVGNERQSVERPRARAVTARASALGADTAAVLAELAIPC